MKHLIFAVGTFLFLASSAVAAENSYPPPPDPGKALSIEDSIYGVLRTHHNLRGMIENREVLSRLWPPCGCYRAGWWQRVERF